MIHKIKNGKENKIKKKKIADKMEQDYLCQHYNNKAIFRNFVLFQCSSLFKNLPLMDEHLLRSRIYTWTLDSLYIFLHIRNLNLKHLFLWFIQD